MITMLLSLLAAAASVQDAPADPLAPARAGKIRCVAPNMEQRTCQAMIRYTPRGVDGFDARVTSIVNRDPVVLIQYDTFGRIEAGGICAMVKQNDFQNGQLLKAGKPLSPADIQFVRLQVLDSVQGILGKKRCFVDRPDEKGGRALTSITTLNGVAANDQTQTVIWVGPEEKFEMGLQTPEP